MAPRNLFLFADGTGNAGGNTRNTNVYRLYESIDRTPGTPEQRTFYDDGVGTSDNMVAKALGGALGWGLSRNIRQMYEWLVFNYADGDRIFIFGFSRGAFTARCLAGMIRRCGVLRKEVYKSLGASQRQDRLKKLVWAYRARSRVPWRGTETHSQRFERWRGPAADFQEVRTYFLGVWDTVDAVGMPLDELRPMVDAASRMLCGRRAYGFDDMELAGVEHARHAIAIDDERRTFHPNVWHKNPARSDEQRAKPGTSGAPTDPANIRQVWFAGAHSNVGGGYPKDQLALVTLDWMMGEMAALEEARVRFIPGKRETFQHEADAHGCQYDPRTGPAVYYRYTPRRVGRFYQGTDDFWMRWYLSLRGQRPAPLPGYGIELHASVFERLQRGTQHYAPLLLPDRPGKDGPPFKIVASFTQGGGPFSREHCENRVGNLPSIVTSAAMNMRESLSRLVSARQASYGVFVIATLVAVFAGYTAGTEIPTAAAGASPSPTKYLTSIGSLAKGLVPELAHPLVDAALAHPRQAATYFLVVLVSGLISLFLKRKIQQHAQTQYEGAVNPSSP